MNNPLKYFAELRDPRVERTREYLLEEILLMVLAAVLSGKLERNRRLLEGQARVAPGFSEIAERHSFSRYLQSGHLGAGSGGVGVSSIAKLTAGEVVAIDGKALRATRETGKQTLVHMVSAWLCFFRGGVFRFSIPCRLTISYSFADAYLSKRAIFQMSG